MRKRFFLISVMVGMLLFVSTSGPVYSQTKGAPIVLKAVTGHPKTYLGNEHIPLFIERIQEGSKGMLKIDWLGGPEVFSSFDQIHALKAGTVDMILYYPFGFMKSVMPECEAKGLSELTEWEERKSGAFELWTEIFEKRVNAKYLGRFHSRIPFSIYCNPKIEKIGDFKGRNIRAMPLYVPFLKALGANPIIIPPPDIYTSMERGVVDGFMWPRVGMISWGLQEVTKYTIEPNLFQIEPATMINLDRWKKIPRDLQVVLMETMKDFEYIATMRTLMVMEMEDKTREKAGMKIIKLSDEDGAKLIKTSYEATWEQVLKAAPEYGPKLKKASSKAAVPKGSFPW